MVEDTEVVLERRGRFFAYAPLVLWIAVILILGSGTGASAQTSRFIRPLIEFFSPDASPGTFLAVHAFIRKTAHFVEYAVLALLAARAFSVFRHRFLLSLAVTAAVACIDEINQSFNSMRTSSGWDVLLDVSGGSAALILLELFRRRRPSASANLNAIQATSDRGRAKASMAGRRQHAGRAEDLAGFPSRRRPDHDVPGPPRDRKGR